MLLVGEVFLLKGWVNVFIIVLNMVVFVVEVKSILIFVLIVFDEKKNIFIKIFLFKVLIFVKIVGWLNVVLKVCIWNW